MAHISGGVFENQRELDGHEEVLKWETFPNELKRCRRVFGIFNSHGYGFAMDQSTVG